jgi:hypothetical protein
LQPNDVVFAEISSSLHLDENEICRAGVLNSMCGANRNVNRFPRVDENLLAVASHSRSAFNYKPMFRAL